MGRLIEVGSSYSCSYTKCETEVGFYQIIIHPGAIIMLRTDVDFSVGDKIYFKPTNNRECRLYHRRSHRGKFLGFALSKPDQDGFVKITLWTDFAYLEKK